MGARRRQPVSPHQTTIREDQHSKNGDTMGNSPLAALPSDLHVQLVPYLDFRALQMLRATNSYYRNLPTPAEIDRAKKAYIQTLLAQEVQEVKRSKARRNSNIVDYSDSFLTCYTCFRRRAITHFANTQASRRRSKGHADAYKRFCCDCAVRLGKWESGTIVTLPDGRNEIYCRRCMRMQQLPPNTMLWSFRLCEDCRVRTGVMDVSQSKVGEPALVRTETGFLFDQLYRRYRNARKPVPEAGWKDLELDLRKLRVDRELLESPS